MRPRSEARTALLASAMALTAHASAVTWKDMAMHAGVPPSIAKATAENMARAGELAVVGSRQVEGSIKPMRLYRPATLSRQTELVNVMRAWPTLQ